MLSVVIPDFKWSLAEESQQLAVRFAFTQPDFGRVTLLHPFVKCRDFLGDMVYANKHKKKVAIYGFTAPETTDLTQWTNLAIEFGTDELFETFCEQAPSLFHYFYGNDLFINDCNGKNILYVEAAGIHTQSIMAISLLTFLLKCAAVPHHDNFNDLAPGLAKYPKELGYYNRTKKYIKLITRNLELLHENRDGVTGHKDEKNLRTDVVHHSSGFVSLINLMLSGSSDNEFANSIRNLHMGEESVMEMMDVIEVVEEDDETEEWFDNEEEEEPV